MVSTNPGSNSLSVIKFLQDPEISPEIKDMCLRLIQNPFINRLLQKTPVSTIFEICQEYQKYPDLYDDVFSGRIKFFLKGIMNDAVPIFNYRKLENNKTLNEYIGPRTLTGQIVEKFDSCQALQNEVKRIMVKVQGNKMLTAAFNRKNEVVSMHVDNVDNEKRPKAFIKFLDNFSTERVDLIRA